MVEAPVEISTLFKVSVSTIAKGFWSQSSKETPNCSNICLKDRILNESILFMSLLLSYQCQPVLNKINGNVLKKN